MRGRNRRNRESWLVIHETNDEAKNETVSYQKGKEKGKKKRPDSKKH